MTTPLFKHGSKSVAAGTTETISIPIPTGTFVIWLRQLYADARADVSYIWGVNGTVIEYNEAIFAGTGKALDMQSDISIILRLENSGSDAKTISYYVIGVMKAK